MSYTSKRKGKVSQTNTSSIGDTNTRLANTHGLAFMMDSSGDVFNRRVTIPSTKSIINFNESGRDKGFTVGGKDMTTQIAKRVKKKKYRLRDNSASRNHKLSDNLGGDLINRAIIAGRTGTKRDREVIVKGFQQLTDTMYAPMAKQDKRVTKKRKTMETEFSQLIDPGVKLTTTSYRKRFKTVKSGLTSALPNLRIGDSSLNSGIGASFDPNLLGNNRPPSPISRSIRDATDTFSSMPQLNLSSTQRKSITTPAKMGKKFVSSSNL